MMRRLRKKRRLLLPLRRLQSKLPELAKASRFYKSGNQTGGLFDRLVITPFLAVSTSWWAWPELS